MTLKKVKDTSLYNKMFSFENNIDITNETEVLYRKNVVIKNIIFLSNLVYTLIFALVSFGDSSNWVLTILCLPLTILVNHTLAKLINKDKDNLIKQEIAMYLCCFYMFLSAILIYVRLKTGLDKTYFGEVGYILLYYSLIICSFYQNKKMLLSVYKWLIVIITIIHFTLTYNIVFSESAAQGFEFFKKFITSIEFKDILLRTIILLIFMLVLYISVSMSNYIQKERTRELLKRKDIEDNFQNIIYNIYESNLNSKVRSKKEIEDAYLISNMSLKLASLYGKDQNFLDELKTYSLIHLNSKIDFTINESLSDEERIKFISKTTKDALYMIKRLKLERKAEDILRTHIDGANNDEFTLNMTKEQDLGDDIILLCDMYVSLRGIRSYKRSFNHDTTINYLKNDFRVYFNQTLFERFIKFEEDFEILYNDYEFKE